MFITRNDGDSWEPRRNGLPTAASVSLGAVPGKILTLCNNGQFYETTDEGATWSLRNTTLSWALCMATDGSSVFAGTKAGLFRSASRLLRLPVVFLPAWPMREYTGHWTTVEPGFSSLSNSLPAKVIFPPCSLQTICSQGECRLSRQFVQGEVSSASL